jgi:Ca2+-binding RTX toxin-like protein
MAFITGTNLGEALLGDRTGAPENDTILARGGDDIVVAGGGNDVLVGDGGRDQLLGGPGSDFLNGVDGDDRLLGDAGADTLVGDVGADVFVYRFLSDSAAFAPGRDTIRDFAHDVDRISLSQIDARAGVAGDQAFTFIGGSAFTGEGQARIFQEPFNGNINTVLELNTSGGSGAESQILLSGTPFLDSGDLIL